MQDLIGKAVFKNGLGYVSKVKGVSGTMALIGSGLKDIHFFADIIWIDAEGNPTGSVEYHDMAVNSYLEEAFDRDLPDVSTSQIAEWQSILLARSNKLAEERKALALSKVAKLEEWRIDHKNLVPAWAVAAIIGELQENKSDSMTDYFHSATIKSVILGFSANKKNCFKEMRKFSANCTHTAHLENAQESAEHRENWTGGNGYYLADSGRYSGWQISKVALGKNPIESLPMGDWCYKDTYIEPKIITSGNGFTLSNGTKEGYIQISFQDKPSEEIREELKLSGFRWSPKNSVWFGKTLELPGKYKTE